MSLRNIGIVALLSIAPFFGISPSFGASTSPQTVSCPTGIKLDSKLACTNGAHAVTFSCPAPYSLIKVSDSSVTCITVTPGPAPACPPATYAGVSDKGEAYCEDLNDQRSKLKCPDGSVPATGQPCPAVSTYVQPTQTLK